jgi:hypothetical protein
MAMHLERVGGRFMAAMAVLLAVGNAAVAQEDKTYRCKVVDVVTWRDDGRLRLDSNPNYMRQVSDGVIIDTLTGAVTYSDGRREVWNVGKRGDRNNDYVLTHTTPPLLIPLKLALALAATDFIRIRA